MVTMELIVSRAPYLKPTHLKLVDLPHQPPHLLPLPLKLLYSSTTSKPLKSSAAFIREAAYQALAEKSIAGVSNLVFENIKFIELARTRCSQITERWSQPKDPLTITPSERPLKNPLYEPQREKLLSEAVP